MAPRRAGLSCGRSSGQATGARNTALVPPRGGNGAVVRAVWRSGLAGDRRPGGKLRGLATVEWRGQSVPLVTSPSYDCGGGRASDR